MPILAPVVDFEPQFLGSHFLHPGPHGLSSPVLASLVSLIAAGEGNLVALQGLGDSVLQEREAKPPVLRLRS